MMKIKILVLIVFIFLPIIVKAEPSNAVKYLMNEPASMWDLGFVRLNQFINREVAYYFTGMSNSYRGYAKYNEEQNRIFVKIILGTNYGSDEACSQTIKRIREYFGHYYKPIPDMFKGMKEIAGISKHFTHYKSESIPKKIRTEIDKMAFVIVEILPDNPPAARCEGLLYSDKTSFVKKTADDRPLLNQKLKSNDKDALK